MFKRKRRVDASTDFPSDGQLQVELDELTATSDSRELTRADTEVREAVQRAAKTDIRKIKLLEQGRCPDCQGRTENFHFTVVCPACGWFRRTTPEGGRSVVYLETGETIECDKVFRGGQDELLCMRDGIVISQVMRSHVRKVDHHWEPEALQKAKAHAHRTRHGVCSWCEKDLEQVAYDAVLVDYVAFGAWQDRYMFCSDRCQDSFRRQFPPRVHRNCYEVDCNSCELCIKRFDTSHASPPRVPSLARG